MVITKERKVEIEINDFDTAKCGECWFINGAYCSLYRTHLRNELTRCDSCIIQYGWPGLNLESAETGE